MSIDELELEDVYDFMERGSVDNAPEEIVEFLSLMDKVRGMLLRIDKYSNDEMIIKDLMLTNKLSRYRAKKLIAQTREYFYCDNIVSKEAWRNLLAEKLDKVINFSMLIMKDVSDADRITKMIQRLAYLRQLDKVDQEELPEELFGKKLVVYSADAEYLGLQKVNRNRLKEIIDTKFGPLTEKERERLYQEADITPFIAFPANEENPRKG